MMKDYTGRPTLSSFLPMVHLDQDGLYESVSSPHNSIFFHVLGINYSLTFISNETVRTKPFFFFFMSIIFFFLPFY